MSAAVTKVADSELTLMELGLFARDEFAEYRKWRRRSKKAACKATAAIFRLGRWLFQAHDRLINAGRGEWTAFLAENDIPRTTEWEARTLFERAKSEAAVSRMTPTEAKRKFNVVPPKKKTTSEPTGHPVEASRATTGSSSDDGVSLPMTPRRPGEPPSDPDRDRRQATDAPARPELAPERFPTPAEQKSDVVEGDASSPFGSSEPDTEPATTADEPPGEQHPLLTTIVQIVRRLEQVAEDLPSLDLTAEPTDAIGREIDQGIAMLTKLKGDIAR